MKSPLAIDKETQKKYKITPEIDVSPVRKLGFLQNQLEELQNMQWRARVDIIHAERLTESTNEVLKHKGHTNMATHVNEVEQATGAIAMIKTYIDELRKEYPELQVEEDGQASSNTAL